MEKETQKEKELSCGIIMPISASTGYPEEHWKQVLKILKTAIDKTEKFKAIPVWENIKSDIIQSTIISNILKCDIIVCDMSTTNPNVMYELGLRMTIKKPVVIIKDDTTKTPFDTNMIRYEPYPKDLHYFKIEKFINTLSASILNTWKEYEDSPEEFTQLVNLQDFKKYKIITTSGEEEHTLEEAINSIYHHIKSNVNPISGSSLHLTELSTAAWEIRGEKNNISKYINEFSEKTRGFLQEPKENSERLIDEEIDELIEKFTVFDNALETFVKTVEGALNE